MAIQPDSPRLPTTGTATTPTLPSPNWQFSLWQLFALTTLAAVAAALAASYGPGTLVLSSGLIIAWLNVSGAFKGLQHGRYQTLVLWLAWITFLVSLALPSVQVFGPVYGIWTAWLALALPVESILKQNEPIRIAWLVYAPINLANGLLLLLPFVIWRQSRGRGQWLCTALCVAMPAVWCLAWSPKGLLVGYYIWSLAFGVALIGIPLRPRLFGAMVAISAALPPIILRWN